MVRFDCFYQTFELIQYFSRLLNIVFYQQNQTLRGKQILNVPEKIFAKKKVQEGGKLEKKF